jgi:hypothetical protein
VTVPKEAILEFISNLLAREMLEARAPEEEEFTLGRDIGARRRALPGEIRSREYSSPVGPRRGIERERISPYSGTRGDPVMSSTARPGENMGWFWTKEGGWDIDPEMALEEAREQGTGMEEPGRVHFPEGFLGSAKGVMVGGPPYPETTYEDLLRARREKFEPPDYWRPSSRYVQAADYPPGMPWLDPTLEPRGTWHPPRIESDRDDPVYPMRDYMPMSENPKTGAWWEGRPPDLPPQEYWGPPMTPQFYGDMGMERAHYLQRSGPGDVPFERPEREIFERRIREAIGQREDRDISRDMEPMAAPGFPGNLSLGTLGGMLPADPGAGQAAPEGELYDMIGQILMGIMGGAGQTPQGPPPMSAPAGSPFPGVAPRVRPPALPQTPGTMGGQQGQIPFIPLVGSQGPLQVMSPDQPYRGY